MEVPLEVALKEELLNIVEESLLNGETNKALDAIQNQKYAACIETSSWDLVPKIVEHLHDGSNSISSGAKETLMALVERASPEEMLLELIEKAEGAKKDECFLALLPAMQLTLARMPEKRGKSLQWCLNTISQHLKVTDHSSESDESESEEENEKEDDGKLDKSTQRAVTIYRAALEFCSPFIEEVSLKVPNQTFDKPVMVQRDRQRRVLQTFLLQALSQTAATANLQVNKNVRNPCRLLAEDIVHAFCNICSDIFFFLNYMEERSKTAQKLRTKDIDQTWENANPFLYEDVVPISGLGVLYNLVLVEGIKAEYAPSVYSPFFIFQSILHVVIGMISCSETMSVLKGLQIAESSLQRLCRPLSADILDDPVHCKFCITAIETIFGSPSVPTARLAVSVFRTYLKTFSHKGQYQILKNLFAAIKMPGPRGFIVTQLKDSIDRSLKDHCNEEGVELFRGTSLFRLITSLCGLSDGLETDVAHHADHILATLNLLWYLALCKESEKLDISLQVVTFQNSLMESLSKMLRECRAKYEQDRMAIIEQKENPTKNCTSQLLSGDCMLNHEEKLQAVDTTINKLILMDSLLSDVHKTMSSSKGNV